MSKPKTTLLSSPPADPKTVEEEAARAGSLASPPKNKPSSKPPETSFEQKILAEISFLQQTMMDRIEQQSSLLVQVTTAMQQTMVVMRSVIAGEDQAIQNLMGVTENLGIALNALTRLYEDQTGETPAGLNQ
jgi:hypothetical protein